MGKKTKKSTNIVGNKGGGNVAKKNTTKGNVVNLGDIRAKFDGLRDRVSKLEDGPAKFALMHEIETVYLDTAGWATSQTATA